MADTLRLTDADIEDAQWHELERSCTKTANMWLMIGCLPEEAYRPSSQASDELREMLNTYGQIHSVKMVDATKNFGRHYLVRYNSRDETEKAIKGMQELVFRGRKIAISWLKCKWPLWKTSSNELGAVYGAGISLYFAFIITLVAAGVIAALLTFPLLYFNYTGDALQSLDAATSSNVLISRLAATTVANLGTWRNITDSAGNILYEMRQVDFRGSTWDIRRVTSAAAAFDGLACLMLWFICLWYELVAVPRSIEKARKKNVTPEVFSLHVTRLPRMLQGNGNYEERLGQHFTRLLKAKIMTPSSAKGQLVVRESDEGSNRIGWRWLCCPCGARGYDTGGRRLGRILDVTAASRRCCVRWMKTRESPVTEEWCSIDDLLDADMLHRLEASGCDKQSYKSHERLVHEVSVVRDFNGHLARMRDTAKNEVKKQEQKIRTQRKKDIKEMMKKRTNPSRMTKMLQPLGGTSANEVYPTIPMNQREVIGAYVIFSRMKHRNFLLNEYRFSRTLFRPLLLPRRLQFNDRKIQVSEAAAPSDIFWENQDYPWSSQVRHQLVVAFACLVCVGFVIGFCSAAKQYADEATTDMASECSAQAAQQSIDCRCAAVGYRDVVRDLPSGIYDLCKGWLETKATAAGIAMGASLSIVLINAAAGYLAVYLAKVEHPSSLTSFNIAVFNISFVLQTLNLGVIAVLVNAKFEKSLRGFTFGLFGDGDYEDLVPGWYVVVGATILTTMLINTFSPVTRGLQVPVYHMSKSDRCCCRQRNKLKSELLELYTPPEFEFALLHSQNLCTIFTSLVLASGMPLLWFLLPFGLVLSYWTDKYILLRGSQMPPRYGGRVMTRMVQWIQFGLYMHAGFAIYVFSNQRSAPSFCTDCDDQDQNTVVQMQTQRITGGIQNDDVEKVLNRTTFTSTLPALYFLLLLSTYYLLRFLYYIFGHSMRSVVKYLRTTKTFKDEHIKQCRCNMIRVLPDRVFYEPFAKTPLREMLRLKVLATYQLTQMPGYEFLQPKSRTNTGGNRKTRTATNGGPSHGTSNNPLGSDKAQAPTNKADPAALRWAAGEDDRDNEYYSLIEAQARQADGSSPSASPYPQQAGDHPTELEAQASEFVEEGSIYEGMILVCQKEGNVYERCYDGGAPMEVVSKVEPGEILIAAGPIEWEGDSAMVPVRPWGLVEMATIMNDNGEVLCPDDADADWWEEAAPHIEMEYEGEYNQEEEEEDEHWDADWTPESANMELISEDGGKTGESTTPEGVSARLTWQEMQEEEDLKVHGTGTAIAHKQTNGAKFVQDVHSRIQQGLEPCSDTDSQELHSAEVEASSPSRKKKRHSTGGQAKKPLAMPKVKVGKVNSYQSEASTKTTASAKSTVSAKSKAKTKAGSSKGKGRGAKPRSDSSPGKAPGANTYGSVQDSDDSA